MRKYLPRATFLDAELARIKQYMDKLRIKPRYYTISTPQTLDSALATPPPQPLIRFSSTLPSSSSDGLSKRNNGPNLESSSWGSGIQTSCRQGSYRTRQLQRRKEGVRTKNFRGIWDLTQAQHPHRLSRSMISPHTLVVIPPVLCYHCQLTFLALFIHCPKELADEPWSDSDDNRSSSPPPPIPFLVEMEAEAKVRRSNEAVELWLGKI